MNSPAAVLSVTQKLDDLFKPWNRSDAPGVVVGVAHKGKMIYRRGFGLASIEHAKANTPATRMRRSAADPASRAGDHGDFCRRCHPSCLLVSDVALLSATRRPGAIAILRGTAHISPS